MIDVLSERFAALADLADDSDWLDVRRRARRAHLRLAAPLAAAVAAVAVAAALAANGGFVFSTHDRHVTASTSVTLNGKTWHVSITSLELGRLCFHVSGPSGRPRSTTCKGRLERLGAKRPFGAVPLDVPGGQIWVGATIGFVRRVAITGAGGTVYRTDAIAAPTGTKTPLRYWALAVAGRATAITASDAHGHAIRRTLR